MQIIKQAFHSLSQLPIMAWKPMPVSLGLPCDLGQSGPLSGLELGFLFSLNGVCLPGIFPFLFDEGALSLPCSTGTTERVCLVQGTAEALNAVHSFIAEKVREIPQAMTKPEVVNILQPQTTMNPDRAKQVSRGKDWVSVKPVRFRRRHFSHITRLLWELNKITLIGRLSIKYMVVVSRIIRESP